MAQKAVRRGSVCRVHPSARRGPRLRLDELEPRVAPSSLLYSMPILDAWGLEHGAWGIEHSAGDEAAEEAENAASPTRPYAHTPTHPLTIPSDAFSPLVPSQLDPPNGKAQAPNSNPPPADRISSNPQIPIPLPSAADEFEISSLEFGAYLEFGAWDLDLPGAEAGSLGHSLGVWDDLPSVPADSPDSDPLTRLPADSLTRPPTSFVHLPDHRPPTPDHPSAPDDASGIVLYVDRPGDPPSLARHVTFHGPSAEDLSALIAHVNEKAHPTPEDECSGFGVQGSGEEGAGDSDIGSAPSGIRLGKDEGGVPRHLVYDRAAAEVAGTQESPNPERVSVSTGGEEGAGMSESPAISGNGRYVAFSSSAANLVPGDSNGYTDIFVYDRQQHAVERVSVASDGTQGDGSSWKPSVSADGRFVAFHSYATNLMPGDTNGYVDVFVYDRQTCTVERVSLASDGTEGNRDSLNPSVSADGRFVAFHSSASNLVPGDTTRGSDVFVYDRQAHVVERVSVGSDAGTERTYSENPSISADGRIVAYQEHVKDLIIGEVVESQVFVHDRQAHTVQLVSVNSLGWPAELHSQNPSVSADGRFVAYDSFAKNLVEMDTNTAADVFVYDRQTHTVERVSVASDGTQGNHNSSEPSVSADGRFVAFKSNATNLVRNDTNLVEDLFVHDRVLHRTQRVSVGSDGAETVGTGSREPHISADGAYVAFTSRADSLVTHDSNSTDDVFVFRREGPRVADLWPTPGSTVPAASSIVVRFNEDLDPGAVNTENKRLFSGPGPDSTWGTADDVLVPVSVAYDSATDTLTITPETPLTSGRYALRLVGGPGPLAVTQDGITDRRGNVLDGEWPGSEPGFPSGDGTPGGDFLATFRVGTPPLNPERVSVAPGGGEPAGSSYRPSLSADGRFVAFDSGSPDLVDDDSNNEKDIFVYDRVTETMELVSRASDDRQGDGASDSAAISANGRFVAFSSWAGNLVPGDTNGYPDVFVHDRETHTTERVSVASDGAQGDFWSGTPSLSADGRFVAFYSSSSNLVVGDTGWDLDVFVRDRQTGATERVSVGLDGAEPNGGSLSPSLSADGRYVAFESTAENLVPGDSNNSQDVFVYDRQGRSARRVSVTSDGAQADNGSRTPCLSADGRYVAFVSSASNLVTGDTNGGEDVFLYDLALPGLVGLVNKAKDGAQANNTAWAPSISADGRYVAFYSNASNLVPGDTNARHDVFVHDRLTGDLERVSVAWNGAQGDHDTWAPSISADAAYVAFESYASNLVPNDTNYAFDVFVYDRSLEDRLGPRVTNLTPAPGSTGAAPSNITATLDETLLATTVTTDSFKISSNPGPDTQWCTADDTYLAGVVSWSASTSLATFTPNAPLPVGVYGVLLASAPGLADLFGNPLDGEWPGTDPGFPSGNGAPGGGFVASFTLGEPGETAELSPTHRRWVFQDEDGDTVTVSFGGSAGLATLRRAAPQGQPGNLEAIAFAGTDQRTSLTVTVKETKGGVPGDGTTVRTISGDGVGTLNMKNVDLVGNTINLTGALKKLVVDDIGNGSHILLGSQGTDQLTITADEVGVVNLTFPGILKSATVSKWTAGTIDVAQVGTLTVKNGVLGARIQADGRVGKVSVTNGDMTGGILADLIGSVTVKNGSLNSELFVANTTAQTRAPALGSVAVTGGNITSTIEVLHGGNAGPISAKAARGVGGTIGRADQDRILVAGQLKSVTADRDIFADILVQNASGATNRNALTLVKAMGGSLFGEVTVENNGNLGTLQAKHIQAEVTVAGKATLVRTELDRVVPGPEPEHFLAEITTRGKATVKGADKTKVNLPTGGTAYVVAVLPQPLLTPSFALSLTSIEAFGDGSERQSEGQSERSCPPRRTED